MGIIRHMAAYLFVVEKATRHRTETLPSQPPDDPITYVPGGEAGDRRPSLGVAGAEDEQSPYGRGTTLCATKRRE
jgi:hypothetical protein